MSTTSTFLPINIGANPNDGTGDDIRIAYNKINYNFLNLYQWAFGTTSTSPAGIAFINLLDTPSNYTTGTANTTNSPIIVGINSAGNGLINSILTGGTGITVTAPTNGIITVSASTSSGGGSGYVGSIGYVGSAGIGYVGSGGGGGTPGGSNTQVQFNNTGTFGGTRMTYNTASGAFTVLAPTSSTSSTFLINQSSGTNWGVVLSNTYTNAIAGISIGGSNNSTTSSFALYQGTNTAYISNQINGPINFYTNNTQRIIIAADGSLIVNTATNDVSLVVYGSTTTYALDVFGSSTTGQSRGVKIAAGTNSSDYSLAVQTASGSNMLTINGNGNVVIQTPGSGSPLIINATTVYPGVQAGASYAAGFDFAGTGNTLGTNSFFIGQNGSGIAQIYQRASTSIQFNIGSSGTLVGQFNSTGGLTIPAPTSGYGLNVSSVSTQPAIFVNGQSGLGSFTGSTPLGLMVGGAASTTDYSGIDFVRSSGTHPNIPFARIGAIFGATSSQLAFGLSTGTTYSGGNGISITAMTINALGVVTAVDYVATSDATLKNVTGNITNALEKIESINGVNYYWNDFAKDIGLTDTTLQLGVLAQEVQNIAPEAVHESNGLMSVNYNKLVPILIEAIKELNKKVNSLSEVK